MISVEGDFVRTCCTGEGEFGIKRGNIGVLAGFGLFLAGIRLSGAKPPLFFLFFDNKNPENKLKVNYLTFILIVGEKIVPQG